jgi:50S ribosomal protein L16 3-hydroxylase
MAEGLLETWLAPLDLTTFRDDYLSKRVLFREPSPARLATVLPLRSWDVADLVRSPGVKALAWFNALDGYHLTTEVPSEAAHKLYRGGLTLYVQEVPELAPVACELARALQVPAHSVKCTLFCNQPGARTRAHFDPVDTLTLQLRGRKRWRVAPNALASNPTTSWATLDGSAKKAELWLYAHGELPAALPAGAEEFTLEPGAVLHVPRGYWHETESDQESVSLHVHHVPLPWVDAVLVTLRGLLLREPAWRECANHLRDPGRAGANAAAIEPLLRSLASAVGRLSVDDVLPTNRPSSGLWGPHDLMQRRARAGFVVEGATAETGLAKVAFVVAEYGSERRTTVEMSAPFLSACRLFVESPAGGPFSASDLAARVPGLDVEEARQLFALLLDVGFLRPA